jgi:hypothetical protein
MKELGNRSRRGSERIGRVRLKESIEEDRA